jgi:hypothetical protein
MNRVKIRFKIAIGLAIAVGAILYAAAPALGSEPVDFASPTGEYPSKVTITSTKMTILEAGKDSVTCGKVEFTGELTKTSETLVLTPAYSECEGDIGGTKSSATVSTGTCKLEFSNLQEGAETEGTISEMTGKESIGPSTCGDIKIEVPKSSCTFEVPAQGPTTGTTIKPSGEEIEMNSAISEASIKYTKGCESTMCGGSKELIPPHVFYVLFERVVHEIIEYIGAHFTLWYNNAQITSLEFVNENEQAELEVRNPNHFPLYYYSNTFTGASGWSLASVMGQPGLACIGIVLTHNKVCKFYLKSPTAKPAEATLYFNGFVFNRAELKVKVK